MIPMVVVVAVVVVLEMVSIITVTMTMSVMTTEDGYEPFADFWYINWILLVFLPYHPWFSGLMCRRMPNSNNP